MNFGVYGSPFFGFTNITSIDEYLFVNNPHLHTLQALL